MLIQPWMQDVLQDSQPSDTGGQTLGNVPVDGTNEGAIAKVSHATRTCTTRSARSDKEELGNASTIEPVTTTRSGRVI